MDSDHQKTADRLDETDFLRIRLLNRNVDYHEAQLELAKLRLMEASRALQEFSFDVWQRYGVTDTRQIDGNTGKIERDTSKMQGAQDGQQT